MPAIAPAHGKVNSLSAAMLVFYCKPFFGQAVFVFSHAVDNRRVRLPISAIL